MPKTETIIIPQRVAVFEDKKTQAKTVAFPFALPKGDNAILMVSLLNRRSWVPSEDIKSITIEFNETKG